MHQNPHFFQNLNIMKRQSFLWEVSLRRATSARFVVGGDCFGWMASVLEIGNRNYSSLLPSSEEEEKESYLLREPNGIGNQWEYQREGRPY